MNLLVLLVLIPFAGASVVALAGKRIKGFRLAQLCTYATLVLAIFFLSKILFLKDPSNAFSYQTKIPWIDLQIGNLKLLVHFWIGLDVLSATLVALTAIVFCVALAHPDSQHKPRLYYALCLMLQGLVYLCLASRDLLLFFMSFELLIVPTYLLIAAWGSPKSPKAALHFLIYNFFGSLCLLWVVVCLYSLSTAEYGIAFPLAHALIKNLNPLLAFLAFMSICVGMSVKLALFPFHSWLPKAHVEAITPLSILLAGILLKMGGYGLIRMLPLFLKQLALCAPYLVTFGLLSMLYGALNAWAQNDTKRTVAYSSMAHMGWIWMGIASLNTFGWTGVVYQLTSHGLITAGLFILVGFLDTQTNSRHLSDLGGLMKPLPRLATLSAAFFFATIGIPAFSGFIAEYLTLVGLYRTPHLSAATPFALAALTGMILLAATFLRLFKNLFQGPLRCPQKPNKDLTGFPYTALILLILCALILGLYPQLLLQKLIPLFESLLISPN